MKSLAIAYDTRTFRSGLRLKGAQVRRSQGVFDSMLNLIDGYKPVVIKGVDKTTGEQFPLKDQKGNRLIKWVRTIQDGNRIITDILNYNNSKIVTARDSKTGDILIKEVEKSKGAKALSAIYKNNKLQAMRLRNLSSSPQKVSYWWGKNKNGKFNKETFDLNRDFFKSILYQEENCPEVKISGE